MRCHRGRCGRRTAFQREPRERGCCRRLRLPAEPEESHQSLRHLAAARALTAAEAAVLCRVAEGLSPRQVADRPHITYATVRTHLLALYQKSGCRRQAALVRLAV